MDFRFLVSSFQILFLFVIILTSQTEKVFAQSKASTPTEAQSKTYLNSENQTEPHWNPDKNRTKSASDTEDWESNLKPKKLPKSTDFFVYGASIGSPAGANLMVGYYFKDIVFRGSGMRWDSEWWGGQADLGYSFFKTPVIAHSFSLVMGTFGNNPYAPQGGGGGRGGQRYYPSGLNVPGYDRNPISFEDALIRSYVSSENSDLNLLLTYESRPNQSVYLTQRYIGLTYDVLVGNFFLQFGGGAGQGDYKNPLLLVQIGFLFDTRGTSE